MFDFQLSRDKKTLDEKLQETQTALESEEGKSKSEHRARLKLESNLQELEEKMDREVAVRDKSGAHACVVDAKVPSAK